MAGVLPHIDTADEYGTLVGDTPLWRRALRAICRRHGLSPVGARRERVGTNVVFAVEGSRFVKLVAPLWRDSFAGELAALAFVDGRLGVSTPRVEASGELDGWPYAILTAVPGAPVRAVWSDIALADRIRIIESLGRCLAALHDLPIKNLGAIDRNWGAFLARRFERCVADQARRGTPRAILDRLPQYLADRAPLLEAPPCRVVPLHADVTASHVMVERRDGRWRLSGLIDFGDVRAGGREYEFATLSGRVLGGQGALQRAFLLAYGYRESELGSELAARFCLHLVLHEFVGLAWILEQFAQDPPRDLEELERRLWPLRPYD